MSDGRVDEFAKWIREGLKRPGLNRAGLAKALGVKGPQVSLLAHGKRRLKADQIPVVEAYLGVPPPYSQGGAIGNSAYDETSHSTLHAATLSVQYAQVIGEIAAGVWREEDVTTQIELPRIPIIPLDFPHSRQFAYRVVGNSMNKKRIWDGDYVVCVPYFERRAELTDGDLAVIERRNGHLVERTLKIIRVTPSEYLLEPQSSEPQHKAIAVPRNASPEDGIEVEVVGFAVGVYAPLT